MQRNYLDEYLFSRHKVQLVEASLIEVHVEKIANEITGSHSNQFNLRKKIEFNDGQYCGFLKVELTSKNSDTKETAFTILMVYKGVFANEGEKSFSNDEMIKMIDNQLVAQLYPFVRGSMATISAFMNVPTIVLPTIDVVNSMSLNDKASDNTKLEQ